MKTITLGQYIKKREWCKYCHNCKRLLTSGIEIFGLPFIYWHRGTQYKEGMYCISCSDYKKLAIIKKGIK